MTGRAPAAVAAVADLAPRLGLPTGGHVVLRDLANVNVRVGPVVARVATVTAEVRGDPEVQARRELTIARHAASHGVGVAPASEVDPGPHTSRGLVITLWDHVAHDPAGPDAATTGRALADLHAALADYRGPTGTATPWFDVQRILDLLGERLGGATDRLRGVLDERWTSLDLGGPLPTVHGDAHPGNLLMTSTGPRWSDLEDAWAGPPEWDLACLATTGRFDGRAAVRAYGAVDVERLERFVAMRRLHAGAWGAAIEHLAPGTFPGAVERLAATVG
ncbi:MAG: phosphotransferase [Acidimicrobiia bacterium]|nr:phosphotransferase [Acidimicrobiia bacterium]